MLGCICWIQTAGLKIPCHAWLATISLCFFVVVEIMITLLDSGNQDLVYSCCGVLVNFMCDDEKRQTFRTESGVSKWVLPRTKNSAKLDVLRQQTLYCFMGYAPCTRLSSKLIALYLGKKKTSQHCLCLTKEKNSSSYETHRLWLTRKPFVKRHSSVGNSFQRYSNSS